MGKNSTVIYHSYRERFKSLSKAQFGELILAALEYDETGEAPEISDAVVNLAFDYIKYDIDTNRESYKETSIKNKAAADKRWGNDANACERIQPHADEQKHADSDRDSDRDSDKGEANASDGAPEACQSVITLTLNDKTEYPISQKYIDEMAELYPAVSMEQQFRAMRAWLINNPTKRKTKTGIKRFINSWLAREQDKGRASPQKEKSEYSNAF